MIPVIYLIRNGGLDSFLAYELEHGEPMNMPTIIELLAEMSIMELPRKIIILNHHSDTSGTEFVYNQSKGKYCQTTLDEDEAWQPAKKKNNITLEFHNHNHYCFLFLCFAGWHFLYVMLTQTFRMRRH